MDCNRHTTVLVIGVALLLAMLTAACGRKAMPVAPGMAVPPRVTDLSAQQEGDTVRLSWSLEAGAPVEAFRVFRDRQPLVNNPCPSCPPDFKPVGRVAVESRDGTVSGRYSETIERGYRYTYYVTGYNGGAAGPPSNHLVIIHE